MPDLSEKDQRAVLDPKKKMDYQFVANNSWQVSGCQIEIDSAIVTLSKIATQPVNALIYRADLAEEVWEAIKEKAAEKQEILVIGLYSRQ